MAAEFIGEPSLDDKYKSYGEMLAILLAQGFIVIVEPVETEDAAILTIQVTFTAKMKLDLNKPPTEAKLDYIKWLEQTVDKMVT